MSGSFGGGSGSVQFETVDGTATAGSDYRAVPAATHTFSDTAKTKQITVETVDDTDVENSEMFTVKLFAASGMDIGIATATVTITDNDTATCPDGQTGTPPDCVPATTGCDAPGARLSSPATAYASTLAPTLIEYPSSTVTAK